MYCSVFVSFTILLVHKIISVAAAILITCLIFKSQNICSALHVQMFQQNSTRHDRVTLRNPVTDRSTVRSVTRPPLIVTALEWVNNARTRATWSSCAGCFRSVVCTWRGSIVSRPRTRYLVWIMPRCDCYYNFCRRGAENARVDNAGVDQSARWNRNEQSRSGQCENGETWAAITYLWVGVTRGYEYRNQTDGEATAQRTLKGPLLLLLLLYYY